MDKFYSQCYRSGLYPCPDHGSHHLFQSRVFFVASSLRACTKAWVHLNMHTINLPASRTTPSLFQLSTPLHVQDYLLTLHYWDWECMIGSFSCTSVARCAHAPKRFTRSIQPNLAQFTIDTTIICLTLDRADRLKKEEEKQRAAQPNLSCISCKKDVKGALVTIGKKKTPNMAWLVFFPLTSILNVSSLFFGTKLSWQGG